VDPFGHTKGGKQNIAVTHNGRVLNTNTPLKDIQAALQDAEARGMSKKHINKLRGLKKVVQRLGVGNICLDLLRDQIILEIEGQDAWIEYCANNPNCQ
jgi:hypothetical protein